MAERVQGNWTRVKYNENGRRCGDSHPRAKLTDNQVEQLRRFIERGGLVKDAAAKFGISVSSASKLYNYARRGEDAREVLVLCGNPQQNDPLVKKIVALISKRWSRESISRHLGVAIKSINLVMKYSVNDLAVA